MTFGKWFEPGAGIAPTHGGFLMCGKNADPGSASIGLFMVKRILTDSGNKILLPLLKRISSLYL